MLVVCGLAETSDWWPRCFDQAAQKPAPTCSAKRSAQRSWVGSSNLMGVYVVGLHKDHMLFYCLIDEKRKHETITNTVYKMQGLNWR